MEYPPYSVLMSVYKREDPTWLRESLDSMIGQTVSPSEIVVVKDGLLSKELNNVIDEYSAQNPGLFKLIEYPENHGLGYALSRGLPECSCEIVARMDSDDIAAPRRMEKQISTMHEGGYDMVGSQVTEFIGCIKNTISISNLPLEHEEILKYSRRRNPFRHPSMVFDKEKALRAGGYSSNYLYFEDWDLFNRMLGIGCRSHNVNEALVNMRVSEDFYSRRGGTEYLAHAYRFKFDQVKNGWFTPIDFLMSFIPQMLVCLMPNRLRSIVYKRLLRK